jgi:hypothetical protein
MDFVWNWNGLDQREQEIRSGDAIGFLFELGEGEFQGAVDGGEKIELSFRRRHFGDIDVEEADRAGLELLPVGQSPSMSGSRLIPCLWRQRCSDERVRCGIVACNA